MDELKKANPDGRFWIKIDATDIKKALMESGKKVWNGDADMGDGALQALRTEYEVLVKLAEGLQSIPISKDTVSSSLKVFVKQLNLDSTFLVSGLKCVRKTFSEKFDKPGTLENTLKNLSWEIIEYQTLIEQTQSLKGNYYNEY